MIKTIVTLLVSAAAAVAVVMPTAGITPVIAQTAQTPASEPAKTATKPTAKPKKPPTAGQIAARERQKKCAAEWKEAKASGKVAKDQTWPKYWSACNKRLKGAT